MAKSDDSLRVGVPIGPPRAELQRARERGERRRAPHVRRGVRGEELAVDEDKVEILAARGLHLCLLRVVGVRRRVRVVRVREGAQEGAGRRGSCRAWRVGGT